MAIRDGSDSDPIAGAGVELISTSNPRYVSQRSGARMVATQSSQSRTTLTIW